MGFFNSISQFAASATASIKAGGVVEPSLEEQRKPQTALKEEVWEMASKQAKVEGRDKVTWSDYQIAALDKDVVAKAQTLGMNEKEWRNASVDQKNVKITNAVIRKSELTPSVDVRAAAVRRALEVSSQTGVAPTLKDIIQNVRVISEQMEKDPAFQLPKTSDAELNDLENLYDLDDDHTISNLYKDNAKQYSFDNAHFEGVTFHPAGTLTEHHTQGASFKDCVFDGMSDADDGLSHMRDQVVLKGGEYNNIRFTNITGGSIDVADGAQIHGMDISGARAKVTIGKASIDNLQATDARIISINAKPGSVISDSNLTGLTVDGNSTLQGVKLERVNFKSANLRDVDLRGATLNQVKFENSDLKDVKLDGAKLNNVSLDAKTARGMIIERAEIKNMTIDGKAITSLDDLKKAGAHVDASTKVTATPEFVAQSRIKGSGVIRDLAAAGNTLKKQSSPAPEIAAAEEHAPKAPIIDRPIIAAPTPAEPKQEAVGALDSLKYIKPPEAINLGADLEKSLAAFARAVTNFNSSETPQRTAETAAKTNQMSVAQTKDYYSRNQGRGQTGTA